jgi:glycerol-1-phosphate dehydrogenase [NAD(P)+]
LSAGPDIPKGGWTALIDEIVAGEWRNPETGALVAVPYESIVFAPSLEGREADLVARLRLGERFVVVADPATYEALGARVVKALTRLGPVRTLVLNQPHADMATVETLKEKLAGEEAVVAVGSGAINDLCKYVTGLDGRRYCVFATAASMNGYTSTTASITLASGLKVSLPSHAPAGVFVDLAVNAAAPGRLSASGYGDTLARSVAQVDWWMSHRLLGTPYFSAPFLIQSLDEPILNARAADLARGDFAAVGYLHRVLTLCGLGVSFTGVSNHGSMGEHQISHYIDCFAGARHPRTLHGQQVGVGALTMARLQQDMLRSEKPPRLRPTRIDEASMIRRMGQEAAASCLTEFKKKACDEKKAEALNAKLQNLWADLRQELQPFIIPAAEMGTMLQASGGPTNAHELNLAPQFYREAVLGAREMRDRYSFLDLAADAGLLEDFVATEA